MVILIGISLTVAIGFLIAFLWSVKSGQYADTYTPSVRVLFDETDDKSSKTKEETNTKKVNQSNS